MIRETDTNNNLDESIEGKTVIFKFFIIQISELKFLMFQNEPESSPNIDIELKSVN